MLGTIRQDITALDPDEQLTFMQAYIERRTADMLKPSTYNPGAKAKKAKEAKAKKPKVKKEKTVSLNKLANLDAETLASLKKTGVLG